MLIWHILIFLRDKKLDKKKQKVVLYCLFCDIIIIVEKWRRWLLVPKERWCLWVVHQNLTERRGIFLTAFEVVQTILGFGSFTITLIGLCYKIFKDKIKK